MVREEAAGFAPVALAEAKAYLRLEAEEEDALVAGLIRAATGLCERFVGQALLARDVEEIIPASTQWRRLTLTPVASVTGVDAIDAAGEASPLPVEAYAVDIDANGDGWARVTAAGGATRVRARYVAGMGDEWNAVPEALRQGIVRLTAHLYAEREGGDGAGPPAAVAALWRPWRRMRLG